jgi:uncharacterized protein YdiU (UPF0061 family)
MQRHAADFTNTFRALIAGRGDAVIGTDSEFQSWQARWDARRQRQSESRADAEALMRRHNPAFIPRNHLVEEVLRAATEEHDLAPLNELLDVLATPYDDERELPPRFSSPGSRLERYQTFCGT